MLWLIAAILLLEILMFFPGWVETIYSTGIYPWWSKFLRVLFGWIPFSIGDIVLYGGGICLVLVLIRRFIKERWRSLVWLLKISLFLYLLFQLSWGLNYHRQGLAKQLDLEVKPYTAEELRMLTNTLHAKLWTYSADPQMLKQQWQKSRAELYTNVEDAWKMTQQKYTWMEVSPLSIKPHLFGKWQGYLGYVGYINPFTGEAQVNFHVPAYSLPFTMVHEMAHQAGYGNEREANFAAWLVARESSSAQLKYSAYLSLFNYAVFEFSRSDTASARILYDSVPLIVKENRQEMADFLKKYESPLQPVLDRTYAFYLRSNKQPEGLASYNRVNAWLIAFARKNSWEAL